MTDAEYTTLQNLMQNPHYKLSDKQKRAMAEYERTSIVTFGAVPVADNTLPTHPVKIKSCVRCK